MEVSVNEPPFTTNGCKETASVTHEKIKTKTTGTTLLLNKRLRVDSSRYQTEKPLTTPYINELNKVVICFLFVIKV